MGMKSNINFTAELDNGWSLKYEWLGNGQVHIGVHWKGKPQATYSGKVTLDGLRTMVDTFDSLDIGEKSAAKTAALEGGSGVRSWSE
jgi:hypothetical protein